VLAIQLNAEGKFRYIMIVYPIATDAHSPGLFAAMAEHFFQPVAKHHQFFGIVHAVDSFPE
jgi:hypothetical protein